MALLRYSALIVLFCLGFYLSAVAGTCFLVDESHMMDAGEKSGYTLFGEWGTRRAVYDRLPLMRPGRQVILLGASNVRESFRSAQLSALVGDVPVQNMAISSGTPRDFGEIAQLAYESVPESSHTDLTFVLGVWYGTFVRDATADFKVVDREALRYGLYRDNGDAGISSTFPHSLLRPVLVGLRPFLLATTLCDDVVLSGRLLLDPSLRTEDLDQVRVTASMRKEAIRLRLANGPLREQYFQELSDVARMISKRGSRLVIVDLPIPNWHSSAVPYFKEYQKRKLPVFAALTRLPGVSYVNMQTGFSDDGFFDSVHVRPKETAKWAQFLAASLK